ncbi:hypothetical protein [Erythrobacter ani]|uniref:Peptidase S74 domain-containing protein n=1 Tax=Erythrobacter ani TaxID=2827235 RepID=A0ABS6SMK1_9SPHN|nr:hypothetical protein [Erythrobacter ani]MBV7266236.1 hypothetical protein [Erythrobacter ani]
MATRSERPSFFEGQYLGSADLESMIAYARRRSREHALAGHSWGIASGLELAELPNDDGGGVDLFVLPGFAWDGYGRTIALLNPVQVPLELFAGLPSGHQEVWIRYDEQPFRGLRQGFETCGVDEAFARVNEGFAIEVGGFTSVQDRQSGVTYAGSAVEDARLVARSLNDISPLMCDASVPHQDFPDDRSRWLIPLGVANWLSGLPGSLQARSDEALRQSRTRRRMSGTVTQDVFAADGIIRLRDRFAQFKDGDSPDDICSADAIGTDDLREEPDRDDSSATTGRLIGNELVWVEGNMRATGQVRLFGTRLELRDENGDEANDVPLYARRAISPNNLDLGQDFQVIIGASGDGADRFTIGNAADYGDLAEHFILRSDGVLAAGIDIPGDLTTNHATFCRTGGVTMALATDTDSGSESRISFQAFPSLTENAFILYEGDGDRLRLCADDDLTNSVTITSSGHIGIRMDEPVTTHVDANDLVVQNPTANVGITLLSESDATGNIHFADGTASSAQSRAGFLRYNHSLNRLHFGTDNTVQATIDAQGDLGLGTESPNARIDIRDTGTTLALRLDAAAIQARDGGANARLELQEDGGGLRIHGDIASSSRCAISSSGNLGVGTDTPSTAIHVQKSSPRVRLDIVGGSFAALDFADNGAIRSSLEYSDSTGRTSLRNSGFSAITVRENRVGINVSGLEPDNHLHVRGSIGGNAGQTENHIALIENNAPSGGDVLALRLGSSLATNSNNFITFFDNTGAIGRIEQGSATTANPGDGGTFLRLVSGGADFAECLPVADQEAIGPGNIVGVKEGQISLYTSSADALLVTTDRAVVVGNAPLDDSELGEMVALIGQVELSMVGVAEPGDFVVPSGREDGSGRAIAADKLTANDIARVVGRVWLVEHPGTAKIAVGMQGAQPGSALAELATQQERRICALERQVAQLAALCAGPSE